MVEPRVASPQTGQGFANTLLECQFVSLKQSTCLFSQRGSPLVVVDSCNVDVVRQHMLDYRVENSDPGLLVCHSTLMNSVLREGNEGALACECRPVVRAHVTTERADEIPFGGSEREWHRLLRSQMNVEPSHDVQG